MTILGLLLDDAYARPHARSALRLARAPVTGLVLALASQEILRGNSSDLVLPHRMALYGCAMSLLVCSAVRMWFPPPADRLQSEDAPAGWLKQPGESPAGSPADIRVLKAIFVIVTGATLETWMFTHAPRPGTTVLPGFLILWAAYRVWKRA
jgi:hypothetical protein